MIATIGLEIASLIAITAEFISRLVLRIKCNSGTGDVNCNTSPTIVVSSVMLTLNAISIFTTVMAIVVVFVLYFKLRIYTTIDNSIEITNQLAKVFPPSDHAAGTGRSDIHGWYNPAQSKLYNRRPNEYSQYT